MVWYFLSAIHKHYDWTHYSHFCFGGLPELYKWNSAVSLCNLMDRLFWEYLHKNLMCRRSAFKDIWTHHNVGYWSSNVGSWWELVEGEWWGYYVLEHLLIYHVAKSWMGVSVWCLWLIWIVVWSSSGLVCIEDLQPSGSQQTRRGNTPPPRFCCDISCKSKCDLLLNFVLHVGAVS
jgi:hypothetical protein